MKAGTRVKYTQKAFENGVAVPTAAQKDKRGTVLLEKRTNPGVWAVLWDGKKQPDYLHVSFLENA